MRFFVECSAKSSEGFRLHKGVVRYAYKAPTVTECERMCHSENKFRCVTYSFRYIPMHFSKRNRYYQKNFPLPGTAQCQGTIACFAIDLLIY